MDESSEEHLATGREPVIDLRSDVASPVGAADGVAEASGAAGTAGTRERLVRAAAEVFSEKGYAGTRVQDIARRAGFTSGALYGHFDGRSALLAEAIAVENDRMLREMSAGLGALDLPMASEVGGALSDFVDLEFSPTDQLLLDGLAICAREPDARQRIGDSLRQLAGQLDERLALMPAAPGSRLEADPGAVSFLLVVFLAGSTAVRAAGLQDLAPADLDELLTGLLTHLGADGDVVRLADDAASDGRPVDAADETA